MVYIRTDGNNRVVMINRVPFDPVQGMGETKEELAKTGFFVNEVPEPKNITGRRAIAMYDPDSNTIYYEYVGIPLSDRERIDLLEGMMNEIITNNNLMTVPDIGVQLSSKATYISVEAEDDRTLEDHEYTIDQLATLENTANYIAHQIISGHMEIAFAYEKFPAIAGMIKSILMDNGIQS